VRRPPIGGGSNRGLMNGRRGKRKAPATSDGWQGAVLVLINWRNAINNTPS